MQFKKIIIPFLTFSFILTALSLAQVKKPPTPPAQPKAINPSSVTEQEVEKIVEITDSVSDIQLNSEKRVRALVDSSAITFERFEEIVQASRNPQAAQNLQLTPDEQKTLGELQPKLVKINQEAQQEFLAVIKSHDMKPQRFQQIMRAAQEHESLANRIEEKRSEQGSGS